MTDRALTAVGLRLIPDWRLADLAQSTYLQRLFEDRAITGVIDVGANCGQYREFLRTQVGYSGPVLSVEPNPSLGEELLRRATLDANWRVAPVALGEAPGTAELHITQLSEFSSLLQPSATSRALFDSRTGVQEVVSVPVDTLDHLIGDSGDWLGDRIYLKLDTQGFDLRVLAGLQAQRDRVVAAQTEAGFTPLYDGAPVLTQSLEAFTQRGFVMSSLYPLPSIHFPRLIECDLHFVNAS